VQAVGWMDGWLESEERGTNQRLVPSSELPCNTATTQPPTHQASNQASEYETLVSTTRISNSEGTSLEQPRQSSSEFTSPHTHSCAVHPTNQPTDNQPTTNQHLLVFVRVAVRCQRPASAPLATIDVQLDVVRSNLINDRRYLYPADSCNKQSIEYTRGV
jgi:hypothetical protein